MAYKSNYSDYAYMYGTDYSDTIYNLGDYVRIYAYDDDDSIKSIGDGVKIFGNDGDDTILSGSSYYGDYSSISGGAGDDYISIGSGASKVTVNGGYDDDTIVASTGYAGVFQFGNYDGYDVITNYGSGDTIHLTGVYYSSNISYYNGGSDFVIYTSGGSITLKNAASKNVQVRLADGTMTTLTPDPINYVNNYTDYAVISDETTNYVDYIYNAGDYAKIYAYGGNDSINSIADRVTIYGGAGNDTITTGNYYGDYSKIYGGSGNDVVKIGTNIRRVTINGGYGNDTITASTSYAGVFQFGNYDGYDVITNYGTGDTIHLTGVYYSSDIGSNYASGSDYIIYTSGGSITLKNAASKKIKIKLASGSMTTLNSGYSYDTADLFAENNFISSNNVDTKLDSIVETKNIGNFEAAQTDKITDNKNLITYAEK